MHVSTELPEICDESRRKAQERNQRLTKPSGSLGRLEELAIWFAGVRGTQQYSVPIRGAMLVFASDHGVTEEGISAYPKAVTQAMVENMLRGGAAINQLCKANRLLMYLVDLGVDGHITATSTRSSVNFLSRKIRKSTSNLRYEPAMTLEEHLQAMDVGREMAEKAIDTGVEVICLGEIGIGNTTPASALTAWFTGAPVDHVTGMGTGIDEGTRRLKEVVILDALERTRALNTTDAQAVICSLGGFEFSAMIGAIITAARWRVPVMLDGFLTNAAALAAQAIQPRITEFLLASHGSAEPGASVALKKLGLEPILNFGLRLGEGTGAALGFGILQQALLLHRQMATFEEAAVPDKLG